MENKYRLVIHNNLGEYKEKLCIRKADEIEFMIRENLLDANKGEYSCEEMRYLFSKRRAKDIMEKSSKSLLVYYENEANEIIALGMVTYRDNHYEATSLNVKKEYKSLGLGRKICEIREEILRNMGVKELYIESLKFENTINFHKKRGFYEIVPVRELNYTIYMKKNLI